MSIFDDLLFQKVLVKLAKRQGVRSNVIVFDNNLLVDFCALPSHGDRVALLLSFLKEENVPVVKTQHLDQKSEETSTKLRNEGNAYHASNLLACAVTKYSESVSAAPVNSTTLSLAFANRGVVLKSMGNYRDCIIDTQRAFDYGYPKSLHYKLFTRLGQCYLHLGQPELALSNFRSALDGIKMSSMKKELSKETSSKIELDMENCVAQKTALATLEQKAVCIPEVPKVSHMSNPETPSASISMSIHHDDDMGRKFVATRDIQPGEVLLVEKGFAAFLTAENRHSHCGHCFKPCHTLLPCCSCSWMMFCSEACRESAQSYHKWECQVVTAEVMENFDSTTLMQVRAISQLGIDNWVTFLENQDNKQDPCQDQRTVGFNKEGKYVSSDPNAIYHLHGPLDIQKLSQQDMSAVVFKHCFEVAKLMKYLKLDEITGYKEIANLLVRLKCIMGPQLITEFSKEKLLFDHIGCAMCATFLLFNHSCDPNTNICHFGDTVVVRSQKTIPKGSQVFISYGRNFKLFPKNVRQEYYKKTMHFECNCVACEKSWPVLMDIPETSHIYLPKDKKFFKSFQISIDNLYAKAYSKSSGWIITKQTLPMFLKHIALMDKHNKTLCRNYVDILEEVRCYFASQAYAHMSQLL